MFSQVLKMKKVQENKKGNYGTVLSAKETMELFWQEMKL